MFQWRANTDETAHAHILRKLAGIFSLDAAHIRLLISSWKRPPSKGIVTVAVKKKNKQKNIELALPCVAVL